MSETQKEYRQRIELEKINDRKVELFDALIYIVSDILDSLPQNKDWLNPDIERVARNIIKESEELQ